MKNFPLILICLLGICLQSSALSCLNDGRYFPFKSHRPMGEESQFDGTFSELKRYQYFNPYPFLLLSKYTREDWRKHLIFLEGKIKTDGRSNADLMTSYGVALVHLGRPQEALDIFLNLEKEKPGLYSNAANLGTTYELLGDDVSALKWITEGLRRDPDSHQGTEWLHVKILEAKLALAEDPGWLENHNILGLDFGDYLKPARPANLDAKASEKIVLALHHQLQERLQFVKPPDPVVGSLLFDLANLAALEVDAITANDLYQFTLTYNPPHKALVEKRAHYYSVVAPVEKLANSAFILSPVLLVTLLIAFVLWLMLARFRRQRLDLKSL